VFKSMALNVSLVH